LIKESKEYGLSMGDRFCLATSQKEGCKVYTADKVWLKLKDKLGIDIICIR
jgi:ribonuclease VapC